jgi:hypothetical protein
MRIARTFDRTSMQDNTSEPALESRGPGTAGEPVRDTTPTNGTGSIADTLRALPIDVQLIADPVVRHAMQVLLNMVERQAAEIRVLRDKNQRLRDEINRLKGEQGRPDVKPSTRGRDISSEKERKRREKQKRRKKRKAKRNKITVHQEKKCLVAKEALPDDAVFKGYRSVVVQDLKIEAENTEFRKEVYYSPSLQKSFVADLPPGYDGEFGPGIRSLAISLKWVCNMSEPKILEFFQEHEVKISAATVSRMLTKKSVEIFHHEKADLYEAGLETGSYAQIDDTSARVDGQNRHTQIVCGEHYAAYFTTERKDRLTILDVLRRFKGRAFLFNDETVSLLEQLRVSKKARAMVAGMPRNERMGEQRFDAVLAELSRGANVAPINLTRIKEAAAVAAYHQETGMPVVEVLLCDDAPQFKLLTGELALCWVHDGRHYKKLEPVVPHHAKLLGAFRERYWDFYAELLAFKAKPTKGKATRLSKKFDTLFATKTGYDALDERIAKTRAKKETLLAVHLRHPELPLHNNACELEARVAARRRDVSLHTRTDEGTAACDTMNSIVRTAKKLGVSAFEYIRDRVSRLFGLQSLADMIRERAAAATRS